MVMNKRSKIILAVAFIVVFTLGFTIGGGCQQRLDGEYIKDLKRQLHWYSSALEESRLYWFERIQELEYDYIIYSQGEK